MRWYGHVCVSMRVCVRVSEPHGYLWLLPTPCCRSSPRALCHEVIKWWWVMRRGSWSRTSLPGCLTPEFLCNGCHLPKCKNACLEGKAEPSPRENNCGSGHQCQSQSPLGISNDTERRWGRNSLIQLLLGVLKMLITWVFRIIHRNGVWLFWGYCKSLSMYS